MPIDDSSMIPDLERLQGEIIEINLLQSLV